MPDLAVEIMSPSNTIAELREKAAWFMQHGTRLVWLVLPDQSGAEICRQADDAAIKVEFVGPDGSLSGEDLLPGFRVGIAEAIPADLSSLCRPDIKSAQATGQPGPGQINPIHDE